MYKIGFIGLGAMGRGICHNLIEAGNELRVFDLSEDARTQFAEAATPCESAVEAAQGSDIVFMSLPNSKVVEATVAELVSAGIEGKLLVDISTSDPTSTRALCDVVREAGGDLIDSPLIAGPQEAWDKTLTIVLGGDKEVVERYADLWPMYSKGHDYVGPSGNGHLMKLAQNWAGLSQAVLYAQIFPVMAHYGIEPETLYKVLDSEFFSNWFFRFYGEKYVIQDYRMDFALNLALKDMTYMKKLCDEVQVPGFMLDGAIDLMRVTLKEAAGERLDTSAVADTMYRYVEGK